MKRSGAGGLVYSTEGGRMCPQCRRPQADCVCAARAKAPPAGDGIARVQRESKGRGGKTVTVVRGLPLDADALAALGWRQLQAVSGRRQTGHMRPPSVE